MQFDPTTPVPFPDDDSLDTLSDPTSAPKSASGLPRRSDRPAGSGASLRTRRINVSYSLGLDLGTTNSAAAVADAQGVRMLSLGEDGPIMESVVHLSTDGTATVGRPAIRRAEADPAGVAREFKRRFGDTTPLLLHGTPVAANDLTLFLAKHLVAAATRLEGGPPDRMVVCHPANWGAFKVSLLSDTLRSAALPPHELISEPEAAAIHYAAQERVADGTTIAVYDLGGGTLDIAILKKTGDRWTLIGRPGGVERLGGIDFDTALFQYVVAELDVDLDAFDDDDPIAQAGVARLRADCNEAKHTLSSDTSATVSALLPGVSQQVRITRGEFESLIGPAIARSLETFDATLAGAEMGYDVIDTVLLVGGSSRIPLVGERVASHTGRPIAVDAHPKHSCALGAARHAWVQSRPTPDVAPPSRQTPPLPIPRSPPMPPPAGDTVGSTPDARADGNDTPSSGATGMGQPLGGMFQELPHISEGLPEFMEHGRPRIPAPRPADPTPPPASRPPQPTHAGSPADALAPDDGWGTRPNPVVVPSPIQTPPSGPVGRAAPVVHPRPRPRRGLGPMAMALLGLMSVALLGGAAWSLGAFDALTDSGSNDVATTTTAATTGSTDLPGSSTEPGFVNVTGCPDDRIPDPTLSYQIKEIAADDRDGGANARSGPSLADPPVTVLPSFTPLVLTNEHCEIDPDGRAWWGVQTEQGVLWVSSNLIVPVG